MVGWVHDDVGMDQRQRSRELMQKWHDYRMNSDVEHPNEVRVIDEIKSEKNAETNNNAHRVHSTATMMEREMRIHSSSLKGTVEAAAWHLHGQTGRHVPNKPHFGKHVSVMNSKAMSNMRRDDGENKSRIVDTQDIESGKRHDYETDVSVDCQGYGDNTLIKSNTLPDDDTNGDLWSTGVASAIVMGTASRYNKTLFMFPHGRRVLLPLLMACMALSLSIFVSRSCRFMSVLPASSSLNQVFQLGPWFYLSNNESSREVCMPYPSDIELDFWFTVARAMSALAVCLGVGLLMWTCTLTCIPYSMSSLSGLGLCFFGASVLQLATTFFYMSNNCKDSEDGYFGGIECTANQDLVFCIAASALYFATGWLLYIAQGVIANDPGASSTEVYTWSAVAKSDDVEKGSMRTIEKSWIRIPDGSTLMATVVVERNKGKKGCIQTTHRVKTEILPAT